jgi:hypothetical protein
MATTATAVNAERADLLAMLAKHRYFLRFTTRELTDEQAGRRTTASELTLGGLIKHVTLVERNWADFLVTGPAAMAGSDAMTEEGFAAWRRQFQLLPEETLAGVLEDYADAAGPGRRAAAAGPSLVPAWGTVVRPPGDPACHHGDRAAFRARRHHPRVA